MDSVLADVIVIWKFDSAPRELQALHIGPDAAEWLVLVPRSLHASDVQELILRQSGLRGAHRSLTAAGDVVYSGTF